LFQSEKYFQEYFPKISEYTKIQAFVSKTKARDFEYQADWNSFVESASDQKVESFMRMARAGKEEDNVMAYVRFLESVKEAEEALVSKWMAKIQEDEHRFIGRRQHVQDPQEAKKQRKQKDPKAMLAEMMRDMGIEDSPPESPAKKGDKKQVKQEQPSPASKGDAKKVQKTPGKPSKVDDVSAAVPASAVVTVFGMSEEERSQKLEETKAKNANKKAQLKARQEMLAERRQESAASAGVVAAAVQQRAERSWVDQAFDAKLSPYSKDQRIDPSIFEGNPDFTMTMKTLDAAGIYVNANVHGNEKGVARWVGADGKNVMVWFDRPHGAQLRMGEKAGWVIGLIKRLRETGKVGG
jgi:hypothetical protein